MTTNQPTVGEVLCELCCKIHPIAKYGFCGYVGGVNCPDLTQALTKLTEIIRGCVTGLDHPVHDGEFLRSYINEKTVRDNLTKAGLPLNKGGENGK